MHKVQFKIYHDVCWGSDIGVKFPEFLLSSVDCRWVDGDVVHILLAQGDSKKFLEIVKYLQSRSDVLTLEKLSESTNRLYLRVSAKKDEHTSQFSDMFFEHACFLIAPTRFEEKHEIWTLGSSNRENISLVYEKLKKNHPVSISYLKEDSFNVLLTQKQQEILNYAKHFGYYEWPRQNSITNICSMINIPKTVFLSHLRKAEKKIMSQFLQDS